MRFFIILSISAISLLYTANLSVADVPNLKFIISAPVRLKGHAVSKLSCSETLNQIVSYKLSPDGRYLFANLTNDRGYRRFDTSLWQCSSISNLPDAFSPDGSLYSYNVPDKSITIYETKTGKIINKVSYGVGKAAAMTPDGKTVVTFDKTIRNSTMQSGIPMFISDSRTKAFPVKLSGHKGEPTAVVISPDGRFIASGATDNSIRIWDSKTGALLQTLVWHLGPISVLAFTQDSAKLVSGSKDNSLAIWRIKDGIRLRELWGHIDEINDLTISNDGRHLISWSYDGELRLWDLENGSCIKTIAFLDKRQKGECRFMPDSNSVIIASQGYRGNVTIVDVDTGKATKKFDRKEDL